MMKGNRYAVPYIHKGGELGSMELYLGEPAVFDSQVLQVGQWSLNHLQFIVKITADYAQPLKITAVAQDILEIVAGGLE